jgi:hypothetical protein
MCQSTLLLITCTYTTPVVPAGTAAAAVAVSPLTETTIRVHIPERVAVATIVTRGATMGVVMALTITAGITGAANVTVHTTMVAPASSKLATIPKTTDAHTTTTGIKTNGAITNTIADAAAHPGVAEAPTPTTGAKTAPPDIQRNGNASSHSRRQGETC